MIEAAADDAAAFVVFWCLFERGNLMKYALIALGVVLFFMVEYRIELKRKEKQVRERDRNLWGHLSEKRYTKDQLQMIASYHRGQVDGFGIDDITWNDLAMDEVFMKLNTTYSSVGEEYLYHTLRTPVFSQDELDKRSNLCDLFANDKKAREDVSFYLSCMGKNYRIPFTEYIVRLMDMTERSNVLHLVQFVLLAVSAVLTIAKPDYGLPMLLIMLLVNIASYYKEKGRVEPFFICIQRIAQLVDSSEKIIALHVAQMDAMTEEMAAVTRQIRHDLRGAGMIQSGGSMGGSLVDIILDYLRMITHIDLMAFNHIFRSLKLREKEVFHLIELMGRLELALATASLREALPVWCKPELSGTKPKLNAEELYHPLINGAVPNSIATDRHVLLTGSNASGKSTFLKTVAINAILAQTLELTAAKSYRSSWFKVYSSMALSDNLFEGESYFIVEIKSLKRIMDKISDSDYPVLCFVDEVLRGTNTVERIAASAQILKRFYGRSALCFAATHDIELTTLLAPYFDNYHFTEDVRENDVCFPYQLKSGPATSRNAIRLLGVMGYEGDLTRKAEETAKRFLESGTWSL